MIKAAVLGSGSKGNSVWVEIAGVQLLLDAGFNKKQMKLRLGTIGKSMDAIQSVLISHYHNDHIQGLKHFGRLKGPSQLPFKVQSFPLKHDEACTGYRLEDGDGNSLVYITDTGEIPCDSLQYMLDSSILIIEANHDMDCMIQGPYPDDLKIRIGETHLENRQMSDLVRLVAWPGLQYVCCCHLSEVNNNIELVRYEAESAVKSIDGCKVVVPGQKNVSEMMTVI